MSSVLSLVADPIQQFRAWFDEAVAAGQPEPEAFALATSSAGRPSVRFVLLRGVDERGFVFYTNLNSRKGREVEAEPEAAAAFRWWALGRQVRVGGTVEVVDALEADRYFAARPRGAQLGAWASAQSEVLGRWSDLEDRVAAEHVRFAGGEVPRPPWWGGLRIRPEELEFWQGRADRLHERHLYTRSAGGWRRSMLYP